MTTLRKATYTKLGLPAFEWMIKLGTKIIGSEAELVLKSRWVVPTKIIESGFHFQYDKLDHALTTIIQKVPAHQYRL